MHGVRLFYDGELAGEARPEKLPVPHPPFVFKYIRSRFKRRDRGVLTAEAIEDGQVVTVVSQRAPGISCQLYLGLMIWEYQ